MKKENVIHICEQKNVRFIHLQFTDLLGMVKSVTIPVQKLGNALEKGVWFDGSAIESFARTYESDMYLKPDISTFALVPWEKGEGYSVARMICDIYLPSGQPFDGDPRYILKKQLEKAKQQGYSYRVSSELEFFLFPVNEKKDPVLIPHDFAGYFDYSSDRAAPLRHALGNVLSEMGREIGTIHHGVAPGQHEVDFCESDALSQADSIITVKSALKALARQFGLYATFMPKPVSGEFGSGMHVHQSLFQGEKNSFYDKNGKYANLSKTAEYFIGGQLESMGEMAAVTNPIVNSYKRLIPGFEAPLYVTWGQIHQNALIRIPRIVEGDENSVRCELRCPDSSTNPYLAFSVMLAAGLQGIEKKIEISDPIDEDMYTFTEKKAQRLRLKMLPNSLGNAMKQFEKSDFIQEVFGEHAFEKYRNAKTLEWKEYSKEISEWEVKKYLSVY